MRHANAGKAETMELLSPRFKHRCSDARCMPPFSAHPASAKCAYFFQLVESHNRHQLHVELQLSSILVIVVFIIVLPAADISICWG